MSVTLQPIVIIAGTAHAWIVRSGKHHERYGDPYEMACVAIQQSPDTVELVALAADAVSPTTMLAMRKALRPLGFRRVRWQRIRNVELSLEPNHAVPQGT